MSSPSVAAAAAAAMPVATASASASASTSASASASASSTSPRLSSSPHSSSSSDTVTCAPSAFSPSSGTASALDTHHHATVLERLVLNGTFCASTAQFCYMPHRAECLLVHALSSLVRQSHCLSAKTSLPRLIPNPKTPILLLILRHLISPPLALYFLALAFFSHHLWPTACIDD